MSLDNRVDTRAERAFWTLVYAAVLIGVGLFLYGAVLALRIRLPWQ